MRNVLGTDQRRISHALSVLENAETIVEAAGGDLLVVRAAALLHDIGIHSAELKHGSSAGRCQELEGPPIAPCVICWGRPGARECACAWILGEKCPGEEFQGKSLLDTPALL